MRTLSLSASGTIRTQNGDIQVERHTAEGVAQRHGVPSRVVPAGLPDRQAAGPERVTRAVFSFGYWAAVEEPQLPLDHASQHAVLHAQLLAALSDQVGQSGHRHVLQEF